MPQPQRRKAIAQNVWRVAAMARQAALQDPFISQKSRMGFWHKRELIDMTFLFPRTI